MKIIKSILFSFNYIFKISKTYIALVLFSAVTTGIYSVLNLYFMKYFIELLTTSSNSFTHILSLNILMLALIVTMHILNSIITHFIEPLCHNKIHIHIQKEIYLKNSNNRVDAYDSPEYYNKLYFTLNNSESHLFSVVQSINLVISAIIAIFGLSAIIISYSPIIVFLCLLSVLFSTLISLKTNNINHKKTISFEEVNRKSFYISRIYYLKEFANEIRIFQNIKNLLNNFLFHLYELNKTLTFKFGRALIPFTLAQSIIPSFINTLILLILSYNTYKGNLSLSSFFVLYSGSQTLYTQLQQIFSVIPSFHNSCLYIEDFQYFLNDERYLFTEGTFELSESLDEIRLENISFKYMDSSKNVLKNINFNLNKGEHIAIVGQNGSGKSTLIKIICGLYLPSTGEIYYNQIKGRSLVRNTIYKRFSLVFQDFQIYSFSIAHNILMREIKSQEDIDLVNDSLKIVGLYDKVSLLPLTYNTFISKEFDENGIQFSGGEAQKLAIARAYAKNADVLVFDEPSSALDPIAEDEIYKIIDNIKIKKLIISISHKLTNIKSANCIICLNQGEVAEIGTHEDLMNLNGIYSQLYNTQISKYKRSS